MVRLHTFYLSPQDWHAPFVLTGAEAHHLHSVLRVRVGEQVRLFDGCGRFGFFTVCLVKKNRVELKLQSEEYGDLPKRKCFLAIAWSKALRRTWLLEKCVELGVSGIYFWQARHSQGRVPAEVAESWQTQLVSAGKQCGNLYLPFCKICPGGIGELFERTAEIENKVLLWENAEASLFVPHFFSTPQTLFILGPEGGLAREEVDFLQQKGVPYCSLGETVLRWETAALAVAALHSCLGRGTDKK